MPWHDKLPSIQPFHYQDHLERILPHQLVELCLLIDDLPPFPSGLPGLLTSYGTIVVQYDQRSSRLKKLCVSCDPKSSSSSLISSSKKHAKRTMSVGLIMSAANQRQCSSRSGGKSEGKIPRQIGRNDTVRRRQTTSLLLSFALCCASSPTFQVVFLRKM